MITEIPGTPEFASIAQRVIWFETPAMALKDPVRFMAYAFRYATHEDMTQLRSVLSDNDLRLALTSAPPGIIDPRSWSYWHVMLGTFPPPAQAGRSFGQQQAVEPLPFP
jgi:hypothetical protein